MDQFQKKFREEATDIINELENLISLFSELVATRAKLSRYTENTMQPELMVITEEFEKISRRFRDGTVALVIDTNKIIYQYSTKENLVAVE